MKRICVFCGSSPGIKRDYIDTTKLLGVTLAKRNITLVYGGAKVGLMGQLAKACLEAGGEVIGVIPKHLVGMELAYNEITQLYKVNSMHERKNKMSDLSDGFIALPGGIGTIEEFFEILTWAQLGLHYKPCGLLNICYYFDQLIKFLDYSVKQQFIESEHRNMIQIDEDPNELINKFELYIAPKTDKAKWVLGLTDNIK
jgi:uncharacterized protein (TIGR00730 family)